MHTSRIRGRSHRLLLGIELATGGSALLCGALIALRPDGSLLGLPVSVLEHGPFSDWRLPGLLLGGFVGLGYLTAGVWEWARLPRSRELSVLAGGGLVVFEAVEWAWLGFHPLQAIFMGVGGAVVALAVRQPTGPGPVVGPVGHSSVELWSGT